MVLSVRGGFGIQFEYNMMELEPIGIPTVIVQDKILEKFEISPDYALVKSPSMDSCRIVVEAFKKAGNRTGLIGQVDAVTELVPAMADQKANQPLITDFAASLAKKPVAARFTQEDRVSLVRELERLHQNIVEIGELSIMGSGEKNKIIRTCDQIVGKKDEESSILALAKSIDEQDRDPGVLAPFQAIMGRVLKERLQSMASTEIIALDNLPNDIRSRYVSPHSGELLISIYPKVLIWEERILRRFKGEPTGIPPRVPGMPVTRGEI